MYKILFANHQIIADFLFKKFYPNISLEQLEARYYSSHREAPGFMALKSKDESKPHLCWHSELSMEIAVPEDNQQFDFILQPMKGQAHYCNNPYYQFQGAHATLFFADMHDLNSLAHLEWAMKILKQGQEADRISKLYPIYLVGLCSSPLENYEESVEVLKAFLEKYDFQGQIHIINIPILEAHASYELEKLLVTVGENILTKEKRLVEKTDALQIFSIFNNETPSQEPQAAVNTSRKPGCTIL